MLFNFENKCIKVENIDSGYMHNCKCKFWIRLCKQKDNGGEAQVQFLVGLVFKK